MIKQKEITQLNIDDYIRERKRANKKYIRWNKNNWKILKAFYMAIMPCKHGWLCFCNEGIKRYERTFKSGKTFMGIKHFYYGKSG